MLDLVDGWADIAAFRAGATAAGWTSEEAESVVSYAIQESFYIKDVGELLYEYCTDESL